MKLDELLEMAAESFSKVKMIYSSNFARRGMVLSLPSHTFDRSVTGSRGMDVTEQHLMDTLQKVLVAYDNKNESLLDAFQLAYNEQRGIEVTFKHPVDNTVVNMPCVIEPIRTNKFKFVIKTIMIKSDFHVHENDIVIVI